MVRNGIVVNSFGAAGPGLSAAGLRVRLCRHDRQTRKAAPLGLLVAMCLIGGLVACARAAPVTLIYDPFDNGELATGGPNAVNGGAVKISNEVHGTGSAGESGGLATATTSGHNNRVGIRTAESFDAVGASTLGSFTVTWEIDSCSINPDTQYGSEGLQLMLHADLGDHIEGNAGTRIGIRIGGTNDGFTVKADNVGTAAITHTLFDVDEAHLGEDPLAQFEDGFGVSLTLDRTGWSFTTTGVLTPEIGSGAGLWTSDNAVGIDGVDDLLDSDSYVVAMAQQAASSASPGGGVTRFVSVDSITVTSDPLVRHSFSGDTGGQNPGASPIVHDDGGGEKLYGTTTYGGVGPDGWDTGEGSGGWGVLYSMDPDGSDYTVLHNFSGTEEDPLGEVYPLGKGRRPNGELVADGTTLYGVTQYTSKYDVGGTLYKVDTDGDNFTVLHSFTGGASDGKYPYSVLQDGSMLYGVTRYGGDADKGTVFGCGTDGTGFSLLHEFSGTDGSEPLGELTLSGTTLYGVTFEGGTSNAGTLFEITGLGGTPTFHTLYEFSGDNGQLHPYDAPVVVVNGTVVSLYGTAAGAWATADGIVWSYVLDTSVEDYWEHGVFTTRVNFSDVDKEGGNPMGGLVLGAPRDGKQYLFGATAGTKLWDPETGVGATIFSLLLDDWDFATEVLFDGEYDPDAITRTPFFVGPADPHMVQFYGTSWDGGTYGYGTVYYFEAPEPATMLLLAVGGSLVLVRRRRRPHSP